MRPKRHFPSSRVVKKEILPKKEILLPIEHPSLNGYKSVTLEKKDDSSVPLRKENSRVSQKSLKVYENLLLVINTKDRVPNVDRLLTSLKRVSSEETLRYLEILIIDDGSSKESLLLLEESIKTFTKVSGIQVTLLKGESQGSLRAKNKGLWTFIERFSYESALFVEDNLVFLHEEIIS